MLLHDSLFFFFFNDTATTEIYTLSLHDALPISLTAAIVASLAGKANSISTIFTLDLYKKYFKRDASEKHLVNVGDRKSTRLNSSHTVISYAVFCLKKKKKN